MSETENYYEILGLSPEANSQEILDAYQKTVLKNPSPRDPSVEKAFSVLSHMKEKEIYDRYGEVDFDSNRRDPTMEIPLVKHGRDPLGKKAKIVILLHYFLGYSIFYPLIATTVLLLIVVGMNWTTIETFESSYFNLLGIFVVMLFVMWRIIKLAKPMLIQDFVLFKSKLKMVIKLSFKTYFIMFGVNILISLLISIVNPEPALNQQAIEQQVLLSPLFVVFLTVLFAPLVEEIVFRGCIFNLLNLKMGVNASAILSGLIFGSMHVIIAIVSGNLLDLLNILTYASMGYFLGRIYYQTETLWAPITLHFINNSIATIVILLLPFFV